MRQVRAAGRRACVIGAGNGGQAAAGHLGAQGWEVSLHDTDAQKVRALREAGRIRVTGKVDATVKPRIVTRDVEEAIEGAELIVVTTTANAHQAVGQACAPHLRGGETFLIMPGYFCGALALRQGLKAAGAREALVYDSESLYFACRAERPGRVRVTGLKPKMRVAAFPGNATDRGLATIRQAFPGVVPAATILDTAFNNVNPMFHPPITLLNIGWIEKTGGNFIFYPDGCTPSVARVIERLDQERLALADHLGVVADPCREILRRWYGSRGRTLYQSIMGTKAYYYAKAPSSLDARYVWEDIPMGLIPYASLAAQCGLKAEATGMLISLACITMGVDYWKEARTTQALGLDTIPPSRLRRFMETGNATT